MAWAWTSFVKNTDTSITLVVILENHRDIYDYGPIYITLNGRTSGNLNSRHWSGQKHWSSEWTFTGLSPNSSYWASMTIGGSPGDGGYYNTAAPKPPTGAPYVTFNGATGRRLSFNVQNIYGADYITAIGLGTDTTEYIYGTGTQFVYGNAYGTEYYVGFKGYNAGGESSRVYQWVTTEPQLPTLTNGGRLANGNQQINVNPFGGGWTSIQVEMWNDAQTVHYATRTQGWNGGYPFSVEFGAMAPNTNYKFRVKAFKTSVNSSYHPESGWSTFYTFLYSVEKPTRWDWYTEKVTNGMYSMYASEWNTFANKINAFRKYKGLNDYIFSNAYSGSEFRFFMQNEARAAINEMANTGIGTVTIGSPVSANELNILRNTLNVIQ